MPYFLVNDFSAGIDLRKSAITAPAGTLRRIKNAHVTPGGEIEKRKKFVPKLTPPVGTFGLAALGSTVYTFSNTTHPATTDYTVQQLVSGTAYQLDTLLDWDIFDGQLYVVARDTNGTIQHFYNGTYVSSGLGTYVRTFKTKMHSVRDKQLYFSAIGDPTQWASGTGYGSVNLANEDAESENLLGLEIYYDKLAVMSRRVTQTWVADPDPLLYDQDQILRNAGTRAPLSVRQFGSGDILYLADSGIRSLRARDSSNAASVSDIGSPVDELVKTIRTTQTDAYIESAQAVTEPITGRFWMVFPGEILVLSLFPSPKVTAWSTYYPTKMVNGVETTFTISDVVATDERIFVRDTDGNLYSYGDEEYDAIEAEILTPYMDADKPATFKTLEAFDAAAKGTWTLYANGNLGVGNAGVYDEADEELIGAFTGATYGQGDMGFDGHVTHLALRLTTTSAEAASLAHLAVHYEEAEDG